MKSEMLKVKCTGMARERRHIDTVFMEPPRSEILSFWSVRDGYRVEEIQPVDMFPHTAHCEAVVRIERA